MVYLVNGDRIYARLAQLFETADDRYNSGLFHFKREPGRHEPPDELTLSLDLDDRLLRDILRGLYYPDSPYEFSVISADILGQVYEQFLGKVIRLTEGHRAVVEDKPEVKKAGGVYYTPTYIVDYIVRQTVGKLIEETSGSATVSVAASGVPPEALSSPADRTEASPRDARAPFSPRGAARILDRVAKIRLLDPACGSGSFLIGAYQYLLDWHRDFYVANDPARWAKGSKPALYQASGGGWKLTIAERKRILLNNIFGVDIDAQAVEVTKLSLLLKVLEGETGQTLQTIFRLFHERALPDLGDNVKCGNSLIGPDFYEQQQLALLDDEDRYRLNVFDWRAEFPHVFGRESSTGELRETPASPLDYTMPGVPLHGSFGKVRYRREQSAKAVPPPLPIASDWEGGFDAVIGNPPYGAFTGEAETAYFRANYRSPANSLDTFLLFMERGHRLLKVGGLLGVIVPSGWVSAPSAKPLRHLFIESFKPLSFVSLPFDVFHAYIDTMVVTAQHVPNRQREADGSVSLVVFPSKFRINSVADFRQFEKSANYRDWLGSRHLEFLVTCSRAETKVLEKVRQRPMSLGEFVLVKRGVEVFAPQPTKAGLVNPKPAFTGTLQRYDLEHGDKRFISYDAEVEASKPFEYFSAPRILLRQVLSRKLRLQAAFTTDSFLTNQSVQSLIANPDIKAAPALPFLLAILNSRLLSWYFVKFNSVARRDDFPKIIIQQTRELPLSAFDPKRDKSVHDRLVALVEQMLSLHRQQAAARTPQEQTALARQIAATDAQIDRLVYDLYGLTEDEIKLVEGTA